MTGFGQTEIDAETALDQRIYEYVQEIKGDETSFSDENVASVSNFVKSIDAKTEDKYTEYKNAADFPDRYFQTFSYVVGDCNYIFVRVVFHHINRRHPASPDGWALMKTTKAFVYGAIR